MHSFIDHKGVERFLGNNPAPLRLSWPLAGSTPEVPLVDRSEWDALIGDDLDWKMEFLPPIAMQNGYGMCFPAGTMIRMGDGTYKQIQDIKVLDKVLSAEGNVRSVDHVMVRKEKKSIYRLHVWGHRHLRATGEHPILTNKGYVQMKDLTKDHFVAFPKYIPQKQKFITTADYLQYGRIYTNRATSIHHRQIPGKAAAMVVKNPPPDVIHLTKDFGWLVGMYLAEGCTSQGKVTWCLHIKEADTYGKRLVEIIKECLGAEASTKLKPQNNVSLVVLYGTWWAKMFEKLCSAGCSGKQLHEDVASGPKEFMEGVLEGWTDGDGLGDKWNGGVTVSHTLAMNMFDIANFLGYKPTVETLDVKTYGQVKSRKKRYIVRWGKCPDKKENRNRQDDQYLWRRVDGVVREDFEGFVFNFEVRGDHSYVAEGIGVHNCNCSATASALEFQHNKEGVDYVQLAAGDLYYRISGGWDRGSTLEDGIAEAFNGIASTKVRPYLDWRSNPTSQQVEDRKANRLLEAYLCPTFAHCMSAVFRGESLITGIMWYNNYNPDKDGWLPRGGGGAGGHAIFGYKPTKRNGVYGIWHRQSWGESWHPSTDNSFVIPESAYSKSIGGWWAVRSVTRESSDLPLPEFLKG